MSQDLEREEFVRNFATALSDAIASGEILPGTQNIIEYTTDDLYGRRCQIPAGTIAQTYVHRTDHISICLKGTVILVDQNGVRTEVSAPDVFITRKGTQRFLLAATDVDFLTVHYHPNADLSNIENDLGCRTMAEYNHLISHEVKP